MPAAATVAPASVVRPVEAPPSGCCRVARAAGAAHCAALLASADGDAAFAEERLARLVGHLWPEVQRLMRRAAAGGLDPEDLAQAYFARFIEKGTMRQLETWHGCLRPFLRTSVRNFVANARDHARAAKRGGRLRRVPFDLVPEGAMRRLLPRDPATPESLLLAEERRRALVRAVAVLRTRLSDGFQQARFEALLQVIAADGDPRALARAWGVRPVAVRVAAHRLRRRLADAVAAPRGATAAERRELRTEVDTARPRGAVTTAGTATGKDRERRSSSSEGRSTTTCCSGWRRTAG
jgi:RNA polymerase sigma-70 factor (ECF subfamily)